MARHPWLLEEATAQYVSLGPRMEPTKRANFFATLEAIRSFAPGAAFDDRFIVTPISGEGSAHVKGNSVAPAAVAAGQSDITVHVLATCLMRAQGGPYRG